MIDHKKILIMVLVLAFPMLIRFFPESDTGSEPELASAIATDGFIRDTNFKPEDLPFSQFETARLPLKIAGLWRTVNAKQLDYEYIFISMTGVQTNYLRTNNGCLTTMGPHQLTFHGDNRYVFTPKKRSAIQLEYVVERTAMKSREITTNGAISPMQYDRVNDYQPEALDVCRTARKRGHPYR